MKDNKVPLADGAMVGFDQACSHIYEPRVWEALMRAPKERRKITQQALKLYHKMIALNAAVARAEKELLRQQLAASLILEDAS